jgi:hypothetical protein
MAVDRRAFLTRAAGGVAARVWLSPLRAQTVTPPPFRAIAFDAFPIFDPRPVFGLAETLFPGKGAAFIHAIEGHHRAARAARRGTARSTSHKQRSITCRQNVCRSGRRHVWQEYPGWISSISWLRVVFRLSTSQPRMPWPKSLRHSAPPPMSVSNATPLLAFVRIDALELLEHIVRHLLIPANAAFRDAPPAFHIPLLMPAPSQPSPGAGSPAPAPRHWRPIAAPTSPLRGAH